MTARSERGAILIQVAVLLLVVTGVSSIVVDYGAMWSAKTQAQNAADAGALSGAIARAFDDTSSSPSTSSGIIYNSTIAGVQANGVWGVTTPSAATEIDYTCPTGWSGRCVHVSVHRDGTHSSDLMSTWFGALFGVSSQGVRATATAHVTDGNGTQCMKPWLVPDKWDDTNGNGKFDAGEHYSAPGWTLDDIGTEILLKPGNPHQAISSSDFFEIDTATDYEENISGCHLEGYVNELVSALPGNRVGPTKHGVEDLVAQDPDATWDSDDNTVVDTCAPHCTGPAGGTPRLAIIAMFSPEEFSGVPNPHGNFDLHIVNMLVLFIEEIQGGNVRGVIAQKPGELIPGAGAPDPTAAFLPVIHLIR